MNLRERPMSSRYADLADVTAGNQSAQTHSAARRPFSMQLQAATAKRRTTPASKRPPILPAIVRF